MCDSSEEPHAVGSRTLGDVCPWSAGAIAICEVGYSADLEPRPSLGTATEQLFSEQVLLCFAKSIPFLDFLWPLMKMASK